MTVNKIVNQKNNEKINNDEEICSFVLSSTCNINMSLMALIPIVIDLFLQ